MYATNREEHREKKKQKSEISSDRVALTVRRTGGWAKDHISLVVIHEKGESRMRGRN